MVSARVPGEPFSAAETVAGRRTQASANSAWVRPRSSRSARIACPNASGFAAKYCMKSPPLADLRDSVIPGIIRDSVNLRRRGGVRGGAASAAAPGFGRRVGRPGRETVVGAVGHGGARSDVIASPAAAPRVPAPGPAEPARETLGRRQ